MRGVIVSKLTNVSRYGFTMQSELDPDNVRMWLLHWDKLDYPIGGFVRELTTDEQFLLDCGVMQRTLAKEIYLTQDQIIPENHGLSNSVIDTYAMLEKQSPGVWAIARTKLPASPWDEIEPKRTFEVEDDGRGMYIRLISAIPVPDRDVPLADILEFKERRQSELLALRAHVEQIYQDVMSAPDRPLAEVSAVEAMQKGARDVLAAEPKFSWKWCDLSGKFNIITGGIAAVSAYSLGLGLLPALAAGAAGAALEIGPSFGLRDSEQSGSPFEYVAHYHHEL